MFFPSSGGLINISGNLSIAGGPGMTLCANNMLSLLGKQVYSIQLIDYSQDTCYPAMKNRKRTLRIKVGRRISTWQHSEPGKIQPNPLSLLEDTKEQRHGAPATELTLTPPKPPLALGARSASGAASQNQISSYQTGIHLPIYPAPRGGFHQG